MTEEEFLFLSLFPLLLLLLPFLLLLRAPPPLPPSRPPRRLSRRLLQQWWEQGDRREAAREAQILWADLTPEEEHKLLLFMSLLLPRTRRHRVDLGYAQGTARQGRKVC